jgi:hypothetical protein
MPFLLAFFYVAMVRRSFSYRPALRGNFRQKVQKDKLKIVYDTFAYYATCQGIFFRKSNYFLAERPLPVGRGRFIRQIHFFFRSI